MVMLLAEIAIAICILEIKLDPNGRPHAWQVRWSAEGFVPLADTGSVITTLNERHTG